MKTSDWENEWCCVFVLMAANSLTAPPPALSVSQCSVTCGQGKTTRQVLCVNFSDQEVNASECDPDDRPATEQDCAMSQCPSRSSEPRPFPSSPNTSARNNLPHSQSHQWRTGPWGAVRHPAPSRSHFGCCSLSIGWWFDFHSLAEGSASPPSPLDATLNMAVSLKNRCTVFAAQVDTYQHIVHNNDRILVMFSLKMLRAPPSLSPPSSLWPSKSASRTYITAWLTSLKNGLVITAFQK